MFDNNYTLLKILNQQLNRNKMIKKIKVTSQRSPISDILHVFLENIFPRKHHLGIERPWAEWKKSLWKAISISPTSLHRILTSCQNWKQSFISQQQGKANVCWWKRVFNLLFSQNTSSFTKFKFHKPPVINNLGSALECLGKESYLFSKSWFLFEISRIFQKWGRSSWLVT